MIATANVVMSASAHVLHADEQGDRHDDPDHEREERHPAAAGQRQARRASRPAAGATGRSRSGTRG